jgi:hypothetical protein
METNCKNMFGIISKISDIVENSKIMTPILEKLLRDYVHIKRCRVVVPALKTGKQKEVDIFLQQCGDVLGAAEILLCRDDVTDKKHLKEANAIIERLSNANSDSIYLAGHHKDYHRLLKIHKTITDFQNTLEQHVPSLAGYKHYVDVENSTYDFRDVYQEAVALHRQLVKSAGVDLGAVTPTLIDHLAGWTAHVCDKVKQEPTFQYGKAKEEHWSDTCAVDEDYEMVKLAEFETPLVTAVMEIQKLLVRFGELPLLANSDIQNRISYGLGRLHDCRTTLLAVTASVSDVTNGRTLGPFTPTERVPTIKEFGGTYHAVLQGTSALIREIEAKLIDGSYDNIPLEPELFKNFCDEVETAKTELGQLWASCHSFTAADLSKAAHINKDLVQIQNGLTSIRRQYMQKQ